MHTVYGDDTFVQKVYRTEGGEANVVNFLAPVEDWSVCHR